MKNLENLMIKRNLSSGILSITLLSLMYSFGTFGFLNLLGARTVVQILLITVLACLFYVMHTKVKVAHFIPVFVFSGLYAVGSIIHGKHLSGLLDVYVLIFCFICLIYAPPLKVIFFAKTLVIVTTFLCVLVVIAFVYYQIYPYEFESANYDIYDSTVGHKQIYPSHFMDWLSFTSGDGFMLNGKSILRLKGYSNEPSSTIVHYLAPAVIAFILGGGFVYLGIFILAVNMVTIGSFTTFVVFTLSLFLLMLNIFPKRLAGFLLTLTGFSFVILILQPNLVFSIFSYVSAEAMQYFGFDMLSRKMGSGVGESSLGQRQSGIIDGMSLALFSPVGYSTDKLGAGSGLFYIISSYTGWLGIFIFSFFITRLIKNIKIILSLSSSLMLKFGVSFLLAILIIVLFVSGYGWSRPPGIIMLLLFFRILQIITVEKEVLPKNILYRYFGNTLTKK